VNTILERLRHALSTAGIPFQELSHPPVFTSEEAAAVRGASLASGAKALLVKAGERFVLLVVPADRKLNSKRAKESLAAKNLRFASKEELLEHTGLASGAVPPFGSLFGLSTYVDPALGDQLRINFNAGSHAVSFSMLWPDYQRFEPMSVAALT
jgi:Ala-tRNA(Pro) deacylase